MKKNLIKNIDLETFLKFIIAGIVNTFFGYSIYWILLMLNMHFTVALLIASIIGILFNFYTTGTYVFNNNNIKLLKKFIAIYLFIYVINLVGIKILIYFGFTPSISGLFMQPSIALLGFILQKKIFSKKK